MEIWFKLLFVIVLTNFACVSQTISKLPVEQIKADDNKFETQTIVSSPLPSKPGYPLGAVHNMYWATPRPPLAETWYIVFGGTVNQVKNIKEKSDNSYIRKHKEGEIKIERVFLNLPAGNRKIDFQPDDVFIGEGFENLKRGDKVIVFINQFYEGDYAYVNIAGTSTPFGIKIKDWNDPIVAALEKSTHCTSTEENWIEGHADKTVKSTAYSCHIKRNNLILSDNELSEIWRRYDPQGFNEIVELQKFQDEGEIH